MFCVIFSSTYFVNQQVAGIENKNSFYLIYTYPIMNPQRETILCTTAKLLERIAYSWDEKTLRAITSQL